MPTSMIVAKLRNSPYDREIESVDFDKLEPEVQVFGKTLMVPI